MVADEPRNEEKVRPANEAAVRDHLANERTLLAWQRTALAVVGIGFLVDRFSLGPAGPTVAGSVVGTLFIVLGAAASLVGAYRFVRTEREIDTQTYRPAVLAHLVLTGAVVAGAIVLGAYLLMYPS